LITYAEMLEATRKGQIKFLASLLIYVGKEQN